MKKYHFTEAEPLIKFIDDNRNVIIGSTLKYLHTLYWPFRGRISYSEKPVILEFDDFCVVIKYFVYSDIEIIVGTKEELIVDNDLLFNVRDVLVDYYGEEFGDGVEKELVENRKIIDIKIDRFSEEFECNTQGDIRPAGGDYFDTIRICMDSGLSLCICGEAAIMDEYVDVWCE